MDRRDKNDMRDCNICCRVLDGCWTLLYVAKSSTRNTRFP